MRDTSGEEYFDRLVTLRSKNWKQWLNVQAPYRWNLKRLNPGRTLDIGCGYGRNLANLEDGVGVDHNQLLVENARSRGLTAYTTAEWADQRPCELGSFDSLLLAHVLEHVSEPSSIEIINDYLSYLKEGGKIILICPQEKGFPTDPTHIRWVNEETLRETGTKLGFAEIKNYSFPFPRIFGKIFIYNEFVYVGKKL